MKVKNIADTIDYIFRKGSQLVRKNYQGVVKNVKYVSKAVKDNPGQVAHIGVDVTLATGFVVSKKKRRDDKREFAEKTLEHKGAIQKHQAEINELKYKREREEYEELLQRVKEALANEGDE